MFGSEVGMDLNAFNEGEFDNHDGYEPVRRGIRSCSHKPVLADFMRDCSRNSFSELSSDYNSCNNTLDSERALCQKQKQPLLLKVSIDEFNELIANPSQPLPELPATDTLPPPVSYTHLTLPTRCLV